MKNINDVFFDGYYKKLWKIMIPDILTTKEIEFMFDYFHLGAESKVIDLMCGYGRHSIALGRKGVHVTAVDNLEEYINEIAGVVSKEKLPVRVVQSDILNYQIDDEYDLAICMGNSLNFFNASETIQLLSNVTAKLNKGGHVLINGWAIAEIVFKSFKERVWGPVGNFKFLNEAKLSFHPTRMEVESTIIAPDGTIEVKAGVDYIFSLNEMENMINEAGLSLKEVYGIPGKRKFMFGDEKIYFVAQKRQG